MYKNYKYRLIDKGENSRYIIIYIEYDLLLDKELMNYINKECICIKKKFLRQSTPTILLTREKNYKKDIDVEVITFDEISSSCVYYNILEYLAQKIIDVIVEYKKSNH